MAKVKNKVTIENTEPENNVVADEIITDEKKTTLDVVKETSKTDAVVEAKKEDIPVKETEKVANKTANKSSKTKKAVKAKTIKTESLSKFLF